MKLYTPIAHYVINPECLKPMHCHSYTGAVAYSNARFGRGSGGIFLNYVGCRGTESSLLSCSNPGIGVHNCRHSEDVGVSCASKFYHNVTGS